MEEVTKPLGWAPYRTEWAVYDDVRMIAGQIDAVFYNPTTRVYHMVDWKTCRVPLDPSEGECFGRRGKVPLNLVIFEISDLVFFNVHTYR